MTAPNHQNKTGDAKQKEGDGVSDRKLEQHTTQKTADESIVDAPMAKKYQENFRSFSDGTKAISPLVLEDSKTGQRFYDGAQNKNTSNSGHSDSHDLKDTIDKGQKNSSDKIHATRDATTDGDKQDYSLKQSFTAYLPDYKTIGLGPAAPRIMSIEFGPSDNAAIETHFKKNLKTRNPETLSDFDKQKLHNLAICDVLIDKYQQAMSKQELHDTQSLPKQVKGLFLAGQALEDGAALGATRAVLHKCIDEGALGDLASGTAIGMAFGQIVAKLASNAHPITRTAALVLQGGGLALAIKQFGDIGHEGVNGFLNSVPALQKLIENPTEQNFLHAKDDVEKELGPPLADAALTGLGMAAAHGIGKAASKTKPSSQPESEPKSDKVQHTEQTDRIKIHEYPDFSVEGDSNDIIRTLKFGDIQKKFAVFKGWCHGDFTKESTSPIKVHILTKSAQDLGRVQAAIIPEIYKDQVLKNHITGWKTIDPLYGTKNEGHPNAVAPTGLDQGAKGFTIYTENAESAVIVQKRLDEICHHKGLGLEAQLKTGNCETVGGLSKRVGLSRDTFEKVLDASRHPGSSIDGAVTNRIEKAFGIGPGKRLSPEQIHILEKQSGIEHGLLTYSDAGKLMLKSNKGMDYYNHGWYSPESGAVKTFGHLTERPALYALYHKYGFDPCDAAVLPVKKG